MTPTDGAPNVIAVVVSVDADRLAILTIAGAPTDAAVAVKDDGDTGTTLTNEPAASVTAVVVKDDADNGTMRTNDAAGKTVAVVVSVAADRECTCAIVALVCVTADVVNEEADKLDPVETRIARVADRHVPAVHAVNDGGSSVPATIS
jgi:hypothetical protein